MRLDQSTSKSTESSWGYKTEGSAGVDVGLGAHLPEGFSPVNGGFKFSGGGSIYASRSTNHSDDSKSSSTISTDAEIVVKAEVSQFKFKVNYRQCMLITATSFAAKLAKDDGMALSKGLYYCADKLKTDVRVETYYLLSREADEGGLLNDNESEHEIGQWNILMRGDSTYQLFAQMIKAMDSKLTLYKLPDFKVDSPEWAEFKMNQDFPGVLSPK